MQAAWDELIALVSIRGQGWNFKLTSAHGDAILTANRTGREALETVASLQRENAELKKQYDQYVQKTNLHMKTLQLNLTTALDNSTTLRTEKVMLTNQLEAISAAKSSAQIASQILEEKLVRERDTLASALDAEKELAKMRIDELQKQLDAIIAIVSRNATPDDDASTTVVE